jgi:hypothetical protein
MTKPKTPVPTALEEQPLKQTRGFAPTRRCISHYEEMS